MTIAKLEREIDALTDLTRAELVAHWRTHYRADPPKGISGSLLVRAITYEMQAKRYGRLQPVTGYESNAYTCEQIKVEISKVDAFELQVAEGAEFSALSIASFLGDLGIGNTIEKRAALKTAKQRRVELNNLAAAQQCP